MHSLGREYAILENYLEESSSKQIKDMHTDMINTVQKLVQNCDTSGLV